MNKSDALAHIERLRCQHNFRSYSVKMNSGSEKEKKGGILWPVNARAH